MKHWTEPMKAEPLDTSAMDLWLAGRRARRVLVIPFTGPLPGGKAGLDMDGEYFDEETDLYGPYEQLRRTRDRVVDWHHDRVPGRGDPTGVMKGAVLGRIVLDDAPVAGEGLWADFWANVGEHRRAMIAQLEEKGIPLYGSSEPVQAGVRYGKAGHIEVWPIVRHTITTSPQNTHAVVPPLKALLDAADIPYDALTVAAVKAATVGMDDTDTGRTGADGLRERDRERRMIALLDQLKHALSAPRRTR